MDDFREGINVPTDLPEENREILKGLEEKDYPRDIGFAAAVLSGFAELIRLIGEFLFGIPDAKVEAPIETGEARPEMEEKPAEAGEKPSEAGEKPADTGEKPAEVDEKPTEADEKPAEVDEKPAETAETDEYNESTERKAAEVMAEVFDRKTLERWPSMDVKERKAKLEEYYYKLSDVLGIPVTELQITDLNPHGSQYFTLGAFYPATGLISIDYRVFESPDNLMQTIHALTHEIRHQYQFNVVNNPEAYPEVSQSQIKEWTNNMPPPWSNYLDADTYGFEAYYNQPIESDAETFTHGVLEEYSKLVNN